MKASQQVLVAAASRLYAPVLVVVALSLLAGRGAGPMVAFAAGVLFALAPLLHMLAFGINSARSSFPPVAARVLLGLGLLAALAGYASGGAAGVLAMAGVFMAAAAAAVLITVVLVGRVPALPDSDW